MNKDCYLCLGPQALIVLAQAVLRLEDGVGVKARVRAHLGGPFSGCPMDQSGRKPHARPPGFLWPIFGEPVGQTPHLCPQDRGQRVWKGSQQELEGLQGGPAAVPELPVP